MSASEELQHLQKMKTAFDELHSAYKDLRTRSEALLRAAEKIAEILFEGLTPLPKHLDAFDEAITAFKGEGK